MASRKNIWGGLDKLEGKEVGSSYKALNKERVRQGYKPEGHGMAKRKALKNKLTGIKGFGEGDPKPEKKRVHSDIEKNPQNYRHYD